MEKTDLIFRQGQPTSLCHRPNLSRQVEVACHGASITRYLRGSVLDRPAVLLTDMAALSPLRDLSWGPAPVCFYGAWPPGPIHRRGLVDPQHRRRLAVARHCVLPVYICPCHDAGMVARGNGQHPQQLQQPSSPPRRQRQDGARDRHGMARHAPAVVKRSCQKLRCAAGSNSAPAWVPEARTVQDQSSCELLMLMRRQTPAVLAPRGHVPSPGTACCEPGGQRPMQAVRASLWDSQDWMLLRNSGPPKTRTGVKLPNRHCLGGRAQFIRCASPQAATVDPGVTAVDEATTASGRGPDAASVWGGAGAGTAPALRGGGALFGPGRPVMGRATELPGVRRRRQLHKRSDLRRHPKLSTFLMLRSEAAVPCTAGATARMSSSAANPYDVSLPSSSGNAAAAIPRVAETARQRRLAEYGVRAQRMKAVHADVSPTAPAASSDALIMPLSAEAAPVGGEPTSPLSTSATSSGMVATASARAGGACSPESNLALDGSAVAPVAAGLADGNNSGGGTCRTAHAAASSAASEGSSSSTLPGIGLSATRIVIAATSVTLATPTKSAPEGVVPVAAVPLSDVAAVAALPSARMPTAAGCVSAPHVFAKSSHVAGWDGPWENCGGGGGGGGSTATAGRGSGIDGGGPDPVASPGLDGDVSPAVTAATAARSLMRAIMTCSHWRQLHTVVRQNGRDLNLLHVTAALGKLARMPLPRPADSNPNPDPGSSPPSAASQAPAAAAGAGPRRREATSGTAAEAPKANHRDAEEVQVLVSELATRFRRHLQTHDGERSDNALVKQHIGAQPHGRVAAGGRRAVPTAHAGNGSPRLGARQVATSLAALARLDGAGWLVGGETALLLQAAVAFAQRLDLGSIPPQELTTLVYGFAKFGHSPGRRWLDAACAAAAPAALERRMCPRQLSTLLWALATLEHPPGEAFMAAWMQAVVRAMPRFNSYDISQALWALATLHRTRSRLLTGAAPATAAAAADLASPPGAPGGQAAPLPHGLPDHFVRNVLGRVRAVLRPGRGGGRAGGWTPQDVCNTLWAVSQLQLAPPRPWVAAVGGVLLAAPGPVLARCQPADLAGLLWALARLMPDARPPRSAMLRVVNAAARSAGRCSEQDLANLLWALGMVRFQPPPDAMRAFGKRLVELCAGGEAGPQLLSTSLWCCVRLRVQPRPALLRRLLDTATLRAQDFNASSAPLLLYCLARLHHLSWLLPEVWPSPGSRLPPQLPQQQQQQPAARSLGIRRDADVAAAWPAARLQECDNDKCDIPVVDVASGRSLDAAALAMVGCSSDLLPGLAPFLDAALRGLSEAELDAGRSRLALPVLLWSVARLGHRPDEAWTRAYLAHSFEVLPLLSAAEACLVVSAMLRLGHLPPPLWLSRAELLMARRWGPTSAREAAELRRELRTLIRRMDRLAAALKSSAGTVAAGAPPAATVARHAGLASQVRCETAAVSAAQPSSSVTGVRDGPKDAEVGLGGSSCGASRVGHGEEPRAAAVAVGPAAGIYTCQDRALWRLRARQRRCEIAARVLGDQRARCRERLRLLIVSMRRLQQGLAGLRARVQLQQQQVKRKEASQADRQAMQHQKQRVCWPEQLQQRVQPYHGPRRHQQAR